MKRQIVIALTLVSIMLLVGTAFLFVATTPAAAYLGPLRPGIGVGPPIRPVIGAPVVVVRPVVVV
jgi:hypothetical protein